MSRIVKTFLYIGGIVVLVSVLFYFFFIHTLRDLSPNFIIRTAQLTFYKVVQKKDEQDVVKGIIDDRLVSSNFFPTGITAEQEGTMFQYFDKDNNSLHMFSMVGLITKWSTIKYYLEVTDRSGQKYYLDLVPLIDQPIHESYKIGQTQTIPKDLSYKFCPWQDIVEIIWSDTQENEELMDKGGTIHIDKINFSRPDEIKFVYRPKRC